MLVLYQFLVFSTTMIDLNTESTLSLCASALCVMESASPTAQWESACGKVLLVKEREAERIIEIP